MAEKKGFSEGLNVGLRMWLLFLVSFYALGTPAVLSILLGAIAGAAAGAIAAWWKINAPPPPITDPDTVEDAASKRKHFFGRAKLLGRERKQIPQGTPSARRSTSLLGWFSEGMVAMRKRRRRGRRR